MMSSSRRSAVSRTGPRGNTTRLYPNVDPQHQQLIRQPSLRPNNPNNYPRNQFHQTNLPSRNEFADRNAALPMRQFVAPGPSAPPHNVTRLDRFMNSVTPIVQAQKPDQRDTLPYYFLGDLWEAFQEWSAYGAGVQYMLNDGMEIMQYYVPYLSGMQIYTDPRNPPEIFGSQAEGKAVQSHGPDQQTSLAGSFASLNLGKQKLKQAASSNNITEVCGPCGKLAYEYMEKERPHLREPLSLKASLLGSAFPNLSKYRSCDLLPSSWIAVAWYPIYRIPAGTMLEDLEVCFLTIHSLSTQPRSLSDPVLENNKVKIRLPAIGVVPYKLKGSKIAPFDNYECRQEDALFRSACNWLINVRACLPDHNFFLLRH